MSDIKVQTFTQGRALREQAEGNAILEELNDALARVKAQIHVVRLAMAGMSDERDIRAFAGERECRRRADAACAARDQTDFSVELHVVKMVNRARVRAVPRPARQRESAPS